ncbi:MAG: ParB/RepB/Spo0J family partition protein, partial [Rhodospirillales bacterium]|nr:ParB/RepB/Spo0J family partition protein [Rhodospirillales bacterium]
GKKKNLGRGLSALLGEDDEFSAEPTGSREARRVPIELLTPGRYQPRQTVADEPLQELAQSISDKGVLQPLLVRHHPDEEGHYEIIAGERRWRAAQLARVHEVPVIIKELDDREALEVGLIENLQREDLSPLDEAEGFRRLKEEFNYTQATLAASLGKSRSHVANTMRLLNLPAPIKDMIERGTLTAGHARAVLNAEDPVKLARTAARRGLNVRQIEKLVQRESRPAKPRAAGKDSDTLALERDLSNLLGLKVGIRFRGGSGTLTIQYQSIEQLDDILHRLSQGAHGAPREAMDDPLAGIMPDDDGMPRFESGDPGRLEVDFTEASPDGTDSRDADMSDRDMLDDPERIAGIPVAPSDDPIEEPE